MKLSRLWVALLTLLILAAVMLINFKGWRPAHELPPIKNTPPVLTRSGLHGPAAPGKSVVVIQTGQERMSNAVRCMAFMMDLSNQLPKERVGPKKHIAALAGAFFFDDCLMSKMSNGYIRITTNELRQSFSNAVAQLYTNNVPPELAKELSRPLLDHPNHPPSLAAMYEHEKRAEDYPELALAGGFDHSFEDRNNLLHVSMDEQYQRMAQDPNLAPTLNVLATAFQQAGITDAEQSDLRELCLGLCEVRTTFYLMYGPSSAASLQKQLTKDGVPQEQVDASIRSQKASDNGEYQAMAESLDKVLKWRLINMFGLDDAAAQALVQAVSPIPVTAFSFAGLQVPAWLH